MQRVALTFEERAGGRNDEKRMAVQFGGIGVKEKTIFSWVHRAPPVFLSLYDQLVIFAKRKSMEREFERQLRRCAIERRPEACLGCGFEHGCSVHGCAVIKKAIETIKELDDFDKTQSALMMKKIRKLELKIAVATAEKPIWEYDDEPLCPRCCEVLEDGDAHCESCDQRIDWSET